MPVCGEKKTSLVFSKDGNEVSFLKKVRVAAATTDSVTFQPEDVHTRHCFHRRGCRGGTGADISPPRTLSWSHRAVRLSLCTHCGPSPTSLFTGEDLKEKAAAQRETEEDCSGCLPGPGSILSPSPASGLSSIKLGCPPCDILLPAPEFSAAVHTGRRAHGPQALVPSQAGIPTWAQGVLGHCVDSWGSGNPAEGSRPASSSQRHRPCTLVSWTDPRVSGKHPNPQDEICFDWNIAARSLNLLDSRLSSERIISSLSLSTFWMP
ncbi:uncharacterized protein LOC135319356 [Camelus dromedarius]|uniref:uncharacterized protein LOC135319356 n=1 Tax=Camelus dromedarius TaxID=9838 RepID=UPI00311A0BF8